MSFCVRLDKKIRLYILSLPRSHQVKIGKLIDSLSENPYPQRTKIVALSSTNFDIKKCKAKKTDSGLESVNTGSFIKSRSHKFSF